MNKKGNHLIHGGSGTRLYTIWKSMRQRCNNKNSSRFHIYGGKGITICKEWDDFEVFKNWSLANGYSEELSIDRIDVNGNYEPLNCRWVSAKTQANNRSSNRTIEYKGIVHTVAEWSDLTGIKAGTIWRRIMVLGWDVERALTTKPTQQERRCLNGSE